MKKLLSIVLSVCLLLSLVIVPVSVNAQEDKLAEYEASTLGTYYKFTFGEDDIYNYIVNEKASYKETEFVPFWSGSALSSAQYKAVTDAVTNEVYDTLEVTSASGVANLTPLTKEGKPFELTPGVEYTVKINYFNPQAGEWTQAYLCVGNANAVAGKAIELYPGYVRSANYAFEGGDLNHVAGWLPAYAFKEGSYGKSSTFASLGAADCAHTEEFGVVCTGHNKYTTSTVKVYREFEKTYSLNPAYYSYDKNTKTYYADMNVYTNTTKNEVGGIIYTLLTEKPVNWDTNWKYYYYLNGEEYKQLTDNTAPEFVADTYYIKGVKTDETVRLNNYLTLSFGGGVIGKGSASYGLYTNYTPEELSDENKEYCNYLIESVEIFSEDYESTIEYIVDGETVKTHTSTANGALPQVIPEAPAGKYFAGWYLEPEFENYFTSATVNFGDTKVYGKFEDYKTEYAFDFDTVTQEAVFYQTLEDGTVATKFDRIGWTWRNCANSTYLYHSNCTWGQSGRTLLVDEDNKLLLLDPTKKYQITVKYRMTEVSGKEDAYITLMAGIGVNPTLIPADAKDPTYKDLRDGNFNVKSSAVKLTEVSEDWITSSFEVDATQLKEGDIPAVGIYVASNGGLDPENPDYKGQLASGVFNKLEVDHIEIKSFDGAITYVEDGKEKAVNAFVGDEIIYPDLKATNNGDAVWSLSEDEYVAPPTVFEESFKVYAIVLPTVGFENHFVADYLKYSMNLTVSDEKVYEGKKAMKYENFGFTIKGTVPSDWETNWTKYYLINDDGTLTQLAGETAPEFVPNKYAEKRGSGPYEHSIALWNLPGDKYYKITFKYFVPATLNNSIKMTPLTGTTNIWGQEFRVVYNNSAYVINSDAKTGEWLEGTIILKSTAAEKADFLYLHVATTAAAPNADTVYFDNFEYEELEDAGTVEYVNGEEVKTVYYVKDQVIAYEELASDRQFDKVWSLDPDKYVPAPAVFSENITVYAIESKVISFENYYGDKVDYVKNSLNVSVSDEFAFTGDKSLKYENFGYTYMAAQPKDWETKWTNYFEINEDGEMVQLGGEAAPEFKERTYIEHRDSQEHAIALWNAPAGKAYKVSFKYYVPNELGSKVTVTPYTNNTNLWSPATLNGVPYGAVWYRDNIFTINTDTATGEWLDGEFYFVSNANNKADLLYLNIKTEVSYTGEIVYFDDFALTEVQVASFVIGEDMNVELYDGIFKDGVITTYYEAGEEITAPLVIDAEGNPVDIWVDAEGNQVTSFVSGGVYTAYVAPAFIYGDCNDDGFVNANDLAVLKLYLVSLGNAGPGADCNADGKVNASDLAVLKLYLVGLAQLGSAQ